MPGVADIPGDHFVTAYIAAQGTAGNADSWPVLVAPADIEVTSVKWVPSANVTGAATNNFAFGLVNEGAAGSGTAAVTTVKTYDNGVNGAADVAETYTLGAAADLLVTAGDVLKWARTVNASGLASPDGIVQIAFRYR